MENRPKRRRYKDNPYNLEINNSKYIINFYDSKKVLQKIEVSEEVFSVFDKSELKDLSQMNEYDNHIEHAALFEEVLNKRAINKTKLTEEIAESNIITEELLNAIKELQTTQKRRLILYYLYDYTLEEIAIKEHCSKVAIKYSLDIAIKNLKKNLKF
jgi:RNA polymerase sigma-70 factor (ECF subfamily)